MIMFSIQAYRVPGGIRSMEVRKTACSWRECPTSCTLAAKLVLLHDGDEESINSHRVLIGGTIT